MQRTPKKLVLNNCPRRIELRLAELQTVLDVRSGFKIVVEILERELTSVLNVNPRTRALIVDIVSSYMTGNHPVNNKDAQQPVPNLRKRYKTELQTLLPPVPLTSHVPCPAPTDPDRGYVTPARKRKHKTIMKKTKTVNRVQDVTSPVADSTQIYHYNVHLSLSVHM